MVPTSPSPNQILNHIQIVTDLINSTNATWKTNIINQIYDQDINHQILAIPLPKISPYSTLDKIIWLYSTTGEYQVKKAYEILDSTTSLPNGGQKSIWKQLWKTPVPHKILTFTWKLLQKALPIIARHSDPNHNPNALPTVLTTLWCIWFHRNQVIFEGKLPNPIETVLTAKSSMNRYQQTSHNFSTTEPQLQQHNPISWHTNTNWQLIITTAGGSKPNSKWQGIAFIGKNRAGDTLF